MQYVQFSMVIHSIPTTNMDDNSIRVRFLNNNV